MQLIIDEMITNISWWFLVEFAKLAHYSAYGGIGSKVKWNFLGACRLKECFEVQTETISEQICWSQLWITYTNQCLQWRCRTLNHESWDGNRYGDFTAELKISPSFPISQPSYLLSFLHTATELLYTVAF